MSFKSPLRMLPGYRAGHEAAMGLVAKSPLLNDLAAYWKLDEASGTRYDSYGTNHLTDNNTVTQAVGKIASAGQFTRINSEFLSIASNATLQFADEPLYLWAWVYLDSKPTTAGIVSKYAGTLDEYRLLYTSASDRFRFDAKGPLENSNVSANTFGAPALSTWYLVEAYHDPDTNFIGIAVNGGTWDTDAHAGGINASDSVFRVGLARAAIDLWDGRVDEVGLRRKVPTVAERALLWNGGSGRTYPF